MKSTCGFLLASFFIGLPVVAQPPASLSADDRAAIEALMTQYAQALSGCRAAEFAGLFVPETGYFASGFRGHMTGRDRLIALVESERQCVMPPASAQTPRPAPTVVLDASAGSVRGIATVTGAEYQDEYAKTPQGWRFASRTVVTTAEKTAGLDWRGLMAIERLAGPNLTDHYEPDKNGVSRLMTSGVRVTVTDDRLTGRAYRKDGKFDDAVYEKLATGEWRVQPVPRLP